MSRLSWLMKETKRWVSGRIITGDQAEQIIGLYPAEHKNRLISVLLLLGAILLGTGIILFFASNWQHIPKWGKVSIVIIPLVLFHLAAHLTCESYPRLSQTLTLLGCVMFGSGIWLVAQIFHINTHFPNGMLFWLLGVLSVALILREELPLGLSALLMASWVLAEQSSSLLIMFIAMMLFGGVFYLTYTLRSSFALVVSLISVCIFVNTEIYLILADNYSFKDAGSLIPFVLLLIGSSYIYMSKHPVNELLKNFPFIYKFLGVVLTGASLFTMSLEFFAYDFIKMRQSGAGYVLFWVLYITVAFLGAYAISRRSTKIKEVLKGNYTWLAVDALVFIMLLIPFNGLTLMIILNLFMFIWALLVIISAYQTQSSLYFILGMVAFNLYVLAEYFNFFWKSLPKSLFFIAGGIVLVLSGALMERQRRKAVLAWQKEVVSSYKIVK
ncbi:DUF2157 domain-containing protein [Pelotomaculum propionicicum]|uniref:DUF2157 domain-containing protein n=1 Tax=Pelotomaculum propionicicum TaxID=258475 RepID=A0A4Y7RLB9_9FIRM|nr:DUF2157 domain-containing protein [Pelotomaculum propionicicum]TEB09653.1 hypothetical protein Pmgp_02962 [Pelotomaculum propionicicum]